MVWQLRDGDEERERKALRLIAVSFFAIAAYVVAEAFRDVAFGSEGGESTLGMARRSSQEIRLRGARRRRQGGLSPATREVST